jgi:condensin-2 complex subunit H2
MLFLGVLGDGGNEIQQPLGQVPPRAVKSSSAARNPAKGNTIPLPNPPPCAPTTRSCLQLATLGHTVMSDGEGDGDDANGAPPTGQAGQMARFEALLRPIRDLTSNWHVDVVAVLSSYMAELGIDLDAVPENARARAAVDFKQAALLVEGSTSVYSRKVDYLYSLVFAAADKIYEARGRAKPSLRAKASSPGAKDIAVGADADDEISFLLLDDLLKETQADRAGITLPERDRSDHAQLARSQNAARLVSVPLHLLPPGPHATRGNASVNPNNNGLRMLDASINVNTGALLLDGIGVDIPAAADTERTGFSGTPYKQGDVYDANHLGNDNDNFDDGNSDNIFGVGNDDNVADFEMPQGDAFGSIKEPLGAVAADLTELRRSARQAENIRRAAPAKQFIDPYAPLDPHDDMRIASCPVQKGKTWAKPKPAAAKSPVNEFEFLSHSLTDHVLGPFDAKYAPKSNRFVSFPAIHQQFMSRMRSLAVVKRRRTRSYDRIAGCGPDVGFVHHIPDFKLIPDGDGDGGIRDAFDKSVESADFDNGDDDGRDDFDGNNFNDDDDEDDQMPVFEPLTDDGPGDGRPGNGIINNGDTLDRRIELIAASYEEACRKYLHETSLLWQEHSTSSQLEQRVSDWRSKIEPLLEEEERRLVFDIRVYGNELLDRFEEMSRTTRSEQTVMSILFSATEVFDVSRMFLATLQLVNSYKIDIIPPAAGVVQTFNPIIKLLGNSNSPLTLDMANVHRMRTPRKVQNSALRLRPSNLFNIPDSTRPQTPPPSKARKAQGKRSRQANATPTSARRAQSKARVANL